MLELEDVEGTVIQERIIETIGKGKEANQLYKPRSGAMNKNMHRYSKELIEYIKEKAGYLLYFFGYVKTDDNPTGFFEFDTHSEENLKFNYGFKEFNQRNLKYVL
jgi:predicted deacetylase